MNVQDRQQVQDIIRGEVSPLMVKLNAIHEQTSKTNGRVNNLEQKTIPLVHERISDAKELARTGANEVAVKLSILNSELTLVKWLTAKPLRLVGFIFLVVLLIENKDILNIVKFFK